MISRQMDNEIDLSKDVAREEKENRKISLFLCVLMVSLFIINIGNIISELVREAVTRDSISLLMKILCATLFVNCISGIIKRFTLDKMVISFLSIIVFVVNLLYDNTQLTDTAITFYTMCFTGFLAASSIADYEMAQRYLLIGSRIVGVLGIIALALSFFGIVSSLKTGGYNMGMGYSCIICIMLLFGNATRKKAIIDYILTVGLLVLVFLYGSRGPLLGISLFVIYFGLKHFFTQKHYIKGVLLTLMIVLILILHEQILMTIDAFLNNHGITSRTAYLFAHSINYDSGRFEIWKILWAEIVNHPFLVRGINADYLVVGTYAHNLFIELLYQHGIVLGGIGCVFVVFEVIKTLRLDVNRAISMLCLIFMFSSIPSLMISGSLWTTQNFWIWLAIVVRVSHFSKENSAPMEF